MNTRRERTLGKDVYGNRVVLIRNRAEGHDLLTDGRVKLSP
jgi:hypothetical protein